MREAPQEVRIIPSMLTEPCDPLPMMDIRTNADLIRALSDTIQAYDVCRARQLALSHAVSSEED